MSSVIAAIIKGLKKTCSVISAIIGKRNGCGIPEYGPNKENKPYTFKDSSVFVAKVEMPDLPEAWDQTYEIVLAINIQVPGNKVSGFDAFVNLPNADEHTSINTVEYVGSFIQVIGSESQLVHRGVRFGIGDKINELDLSKKSSILVSMVRRGYKDSPIIITNMGITLESLNE